MQKTEQRAFAATIVIKGREYINAWSVRPLAKQVRANAPHWNGETWPEAKRRGWRIRPVLIRVEDETQETTP